MKLFNSHLNIAELADAADGSQTLAANSANQAHLSGCEFCAAQVTALETAIDIMRRDDSRPAPLSAVKFAKDIFRASRSFVPAPKSIFEQIRATLTLDLSTNAPAFGERSAGIAAERQMLFAAGEFDIELRVRETGDGFAARGQVLGELDKNYAVRIANCDLTFDAAVDASGQFEFPNLPTIDDWQISLIIN